VQGAPPSATELDAYRERAERFLAERDEEEYLHYAGRKPELDLAAVYERHADLTSLEAARRVGEAVEGRRNRELWRFACEGYLGSVTRGAEERIAARETELTAVQDGREISYRMLRPAIANEPDRSRRRDLERQRSSLTEEHLTPLALEQLGAAHEAARALGAQTYTALYRDRFGFDLDSLAAQCRALLESTERLYEERMDRRLRAHVGVGLAEAEYHDLVRLLRGSGWDAGFPADRMLPALRATLGDLGIRLEEQRNVELDLDQRPTKSPRAFCSPIEVPARVVLVLQPVGGPEDWHALFHEAGHTQHFAHTSPLLRIEERKLGDDAVTEGWAALFDLLVADPAWLSRQLDFPRPRDYAADFAAVNLFFARRYSAKLLYELELHAADDPTALRPRYVELLGDAVKIEPAAADYLGDVDPGFYCTCYLRSWAFEAQLREFLREEFGEGWFGRREAGLLLRELWELGQRPTADELLRDVTGADLELEAFTDRVRADLRGGS
jgi:hypothetical protein